MGKGIQITNTVILGLIAIPLTFFTITVFLTYFARGQSQMLLNFSFAIYFLIWITSVIYFIFLLLSFKKCNVENKSFKWAFYLNVIWIGLAFLLFLGLMLFTITSSPATLSGGFDVIDKANNISNMIEPILGIIYFISFVVFMIGYFKNKKGHPTQRQF